MIRRAALAAACLVLLLSSTAGAYPSFPGTPPTPPAPNGDCKKILVVGDSVAKGIGNELQTQLAQSGYCSTVANEALSATSICYWDLGVMASKLAAHPDADIVVGHWLGNEWPGPPWCPSWTAPGFAWYLNAQASLQSIESDVAAADLPFYVVVPAPSYRQCYPPTSAYVSALWKNWANWQSTYVADALEANLRPVFGYPNADTYQSWFTFSNGASAALRTDADCVHFTTLGYKYAANTVRAAISVEW